MGRTWKYQPEINGEFNPQGLADVGDSIRNKVSLFNVFMDQLKRSLPEKKFPVVKFGFERQFIEAENMRIPEQDLR